MNSSSPRRGSALILVLWCLLLLGMAVFGVVDIVELSVEHSAHNQMALEARSLAATGVALGLNSQVLKDDPILSQQPAPGRQFTVHLENEGARLNLNYVLLSQHREILVNLFIQWGLKIADADHVADCLYDWVTPGDLRSLNGAKADDYTRAGLQQRPTSSPFLTFDEVELVIGMDLVEKARPNWRDSFTLWSSGPLNVNEAPPDLIAAVFGLDPKRVQAFTDVRNGRDGIPGTSDDVPVPDLLHFQSELGLNDLIIKAYGGQISFNDPTRRVESIGQVEGVRVIISTVTRLGTSPIQYLTWLEQ
jgi:type II secretory pathway component PulK